MLQLRDCALAVTNKSKKIAISEMLSTKLKFAADYLLKWFNKKFKLNNLSLRNDTKRVYELAHPINWTNGHCCLCPFPLEINPTAYDADKNTCPMLTLSYSKNINF